MLAFYDQQSREPEQIDLQTKTVAGVAFVFATYSLITGLLFLHFRNWDIIILKQVAGTIAYPLLLFGGVAFSFQYFRKTLWVLPIALLIFMGMPFGVSLIGGWSLFPVGLLGVGTTIWTIWRSQSFRPSSILFMRLAVGVGLALIYFFILNGSGVATVFSDISAYTGTISQDTLFHSTIINMIAYFSTPSTGLDGIQPLLYHVGVHRWIAANLRALGGNTILLLSISNQVALIPAFFFSTTLAINSLSSTLPSVLRAVASTFIILWFMTYPSWDAILLSESYNFSLSIFVAMLPIGRSWLVRSCQSEKFIAIKPWEIALAVVAVTACWAAKISSGLILAVYILACILIPKFLQNPKEFLLPIAAIIGFACLGLIGFIKFGRIPILFHIFPFHFVRTNPVQLLSLSGFFSLSLGLLLLLAKRSEKLIWYSTVLVLIVTFFVSLIPGAVLDMGEGSAVYFIQDAILISFIYSTAALVSYLRTQTSVSLLAYSDLGGHQWEYLARWLTWGLLGLIIINNLSIVYGARVLRFALGELSRFNPQQTIEQQELLNWYSRNREQVRELFLSPLLSPLKVYKLLLDSELRLLYICKGQIGYILSPSRVDIHLLNPQSKLLYIENTVSEMKIAADEKTMLYIPPTFEAFWEDKAAQNCWVRPLLLTAVIGLPLLNGVRSGLEVCESLNSFGMADYAADSLNKLLSDTEICEKAKKLGFSHVLEVGENRKYLHTCR